MILSILIPTLPDRKHFLNDLKKEIYSQIDEFKLQGFIEILEDERERLELGGVTTGEKRNSLHARARGQYVWFLDDDDMLLSKALFNIINAARLNPDVIGINGIMTTDGGNQQGWEIRLGHPYTAVLKDGKEYYLRFPNHITPMKREHAIKASFPHKTIFEDFEWAEKIRNLNVLKTQEIITEPVYHYKVRSKK